jgi:hypothetical protein
MDLTQIQAALTSLACAAVTAGIAYGCSWLASHLHLTKTDSAEAAVRTAAATEAGKLVATIPAATIASAPTGNQTPASLISIGSIQSAAGKVISDLPNEVKLTGYTTNDIVDMILGNLPALLGAINPAWGTVAATAAAVIKGAAAPTIVPKTIV